MREEGWFKPRPCPDSWRKLMAMSELMLRHRAQRQGLMEQKCLTCTSLVYCYSSFAGKYEFTEVPAECHSSLNVSCQYSISHLSRLGRSDEQGDTLFCSSPTVYCKRETDGLIYSLSSSFQQILMLAEVLICQSPRGVTFCPDKQFPSHIFHYPHTVHLHQPLPRRG